MVKNTALSQLETTILKIEGAYAPSTIRAYKANFERFIQYCEGMGRTSFPASPIDIASYITHLTNGGLKSASIRIAVASISSVHKINQLHDPTLHPDVKIELRRMHRTIGRASKQAVGITAPILKKMVATTKNDLRGLRDRALILLAYDSLCRRSELISLRINDIQYDEFNLPKNIRLRKSKTDQEAIGKMIKLTNKTQEAIKNWILNGNIVEGFLFRGIRNNGDILEGLNAGQINRIYKKLAKAAGLSEEKIQGISGHSMRIGAAQDMMSSGASLPILMTRGRWSKPETVMRYIEFA